MIAILTLLRGERFSSWFDKIKKMEDNLITQVVTVGTFDPKLQKGIHVRRTFKSDLVGQELVNEYGLALAAGLKKVTAPIVLVLDDDVSIKKPSTCLSQLTESLAKADAACGVYPPKGDRSAFMGGGFSMALFDHGNRFLPMWWNLLPKNGEFEIAGGFNGFMAMKTETLRSLLPLTSESSIETHYMIASKFKERGLKFLANANVQANHG